MSNNNFYNGDPMYPAASGNEPHPNFVEGAYQEGSSGGDESRSRHSGSSSKYAREEGRRRRRSRSRSHDDRSPVSERRHRHGSSRKGGSSSASASASGSGSSSRRSPAPKRELPPRTKRTFFDVTPEEMGMLGMTPMGVPSEQLGNVGIDGIAPTAPLGAHFAPTSIAAPTPSVGAPAVQMKQFIPLAQQTPQQRQQRRLYVGNIPRDVSEDEIRDFFNEAMRHTFRVEGDCVINTQINYEKNFIFLDLRTPEEASEAMGLDGIKLRDHMLKVRRPNNYVPPTSNESLMKPAAAATLGLVSTNVPDSPNKLFVGGLPGQMSEEQVLNVLQNIGPLLAFNLVKDLNTGASKGYGFCVFTTDEATEKAIEVLNGIDMGGKKLLVQRASVGKAPLIEDISVPQDSHQGAIHNLLNLNMRLDQALSTLFAANQVKVDPTPILVLLNIVTMRDLLDEHEYEDTMLQTEHEAKQYGTLKTIVIPRPHSNEKIEIGDADIDYSALTPFDDNNHGVGKVLLEYETAQQAEHAQQEFAGRKFSGRTCITTYHDITDFHNKKY